MGWVLAARSSFEQFERDILHWLTCRMDVAWLGEVMVAVQSKKLGVPLFLVLAGILAFWNWRGAMRAIGAAAMGFGLCMLLASLLWHVVDRKRPPHHYERHLVTAQEKAGCASDPEALALYKSVSKRPSFPSRHGMTVGAFVTAMFLASRWAGVLALLYGLLVAVGRVYVARHWPSDVVVGVGLGCLGAWLSWRLVPPILGALPPGLRFLVEDPHAVPEAASGEEGASE